MGDGIENSKMQKFKMGEIAVAKMADDILS